MLINKMTGSVLIVLHVLVHLHSPACTSSSFIPTCTSSFIPTSTCSFIPTCTI